MNDQINEHSTGGKARLRLLRRDIRIADGRKRNATLYSTRCIFTMRCFFPVCNMKFFHSAIIFRLILKIPHPNPSPGRSFLARREANACLLLAARSSLGEGLSISTGYPNKSSVSCTFRGMPCAVGLIMYWSNALFAAWLSLNPSSSRLANLYSLSM